MARTVSNQLCVSALARRSEASRNNSPMQLYVRGGLRSCSPLRKFPGNGVKWWVRAGGRKRTVWLAQSAGMFPRATLRGPNFSVSLFAPLNFGISPRAFFATGAQ